MGSSMVRGVARGEVLRIVSFDSGSVDDLLEAIARHVADPNFVGRLEGDLVAPDGRNAHFVVLIVRGKIVGLGLEIDGEIVGGSNALAKLAELLASSRGYVEITKLSEAGIELDLEYNQSIRVGEELTLNDYVSYVKRLIQERRSIERAKPKVVEFPTPPTKEVEVVERSTAPTPTTEERVEVAKPEVPTVATERRLVDTIERLEKGLATQEPKLSFAEEIELEVPMIDEIDSVSQSVASHLYEIVPRIFVVSSPVTRGSGDVKQIVECAKKISSQEESDKLTLLIVRKDREAHYIFMYRGQVCAALTIDEPLLKPLALGGEALKALMATENASYVLWRVPCGSQKLKELLDLCQTMMKSVAEGEEKTEEREKMERIEKKPEEVSERGLRKLFGRLARKRQGGR